MTKNLLPYFSAVFLKAGTAAAFLLLTSLNGIGQNLKTGNPLNLESQKIFNRAFEAFTENQKGKSEIPSLSSRSMAVNSLPLTSQMFNPNGTTGWTLNYNGRYTYDTQGNQTSFTQIPVSPYPSIKDSALYDAHGNETFEGGYTRNASSTIWVLNYAYRRQYTYNAAGQPLEIITEEKNLVGWENSGRAVYVYNAAGFTTEYTGYTWLNNNWVPVQKFIYGFGVATNPPTSMTIQTYNGSGWVNQTRFQNITWHNIIPGAYLTREQQTWSMNAWVNQSKEIVVYDPLGGSVSVSQTWAGLNWVNSGRSTIILNTHSHITSLKRETWYNNNWAFNQERQFLLTYNAASQLTEQISREWDSMTSTMKNSSRTTYSNFLVMGTQKELPKLQIKIYPNPTADFITLQLSTKETPQAMLTDLTGREVLSQRLTASETRLDLSGLAKGTYLLRLQTPTGSSLQKVIKQ